MKQKILIVLLIVCFSCSTKQEKEITQKVEKVTFSKEVVNQLIQLPVKCIQQEYPNKLSQVIGDDSYLKPPRELHPSFYGCFDWHSSVHGHWSLVKLLKDNPELENFEEIIRMLKQNINEENILQEVTYFDDKYNKNYERTYGWAWLLKLAEELHTWDNEHAKKLASDLQPLTDLIVGKYIDFLPKLNYPIRVGTHTNTAFGLVFAYDYAKTIKNEALLDAITQRALYFYKDDADCPLSWEPSGYDFLSPCLEEAALMKRILSEKEFEGWLQSFLPQLTDQNFTLRVGEVSDREDGHLVHLDGVNFSRAWCLNEIAKDIPALAHLNVIANEHINYSLPNLVGDSYEGGHWLASFAIYAIDTQ